ncbi:MAG: class I SAM-dependent methyltransferase [Bryobacterales bacterium]|nr:class I SAM-dependent methyltransferase [Bryobacterales bacterium]
MAKITALTEDLCRYMLRNRAEEASVLRDLRRETESSVGDQAGMMISEEQGVLLRILTGALAPRLAIEIGTFTGYSSACIASALPSGGKLICCDLSEEWTSIGVPYWRRCGVADRIELRIAAALDTLAALPEDTVIDFVFLDADKHNYVAYYEAILPALRPNGLIAVDNVMWHNWSMDAENQDPETVGIREFNDHVLRDSRVESVMLHVGDGLTLVRKL